MESPVQIHMKHDMETGIYKEHLGQGKLTHCKSLQRVFIGFYVQIKSSHT